MVYNVEDKVPFKKLCLFSLQMMLAVFTATALIAQICEVPLSGALVGAGISTIVYAVCTQFKSPMFISNSGAFVAPVIAAMAAGGYTAIAIGGIVSALVYCLFGLIFSKVEVNKLYKFMPKVLIGSVTVVIGVNLMSFISGYIGDTGYKGILLAFVTIFAIALSSHYLKGTLSLFPFLIGTVVGYIVAIPLGMVDFTKFNDIHVFALPSFAFTKFEAVEFKKLIPVIINYAAFTVSAICECLSDHATLGNIVGIDLYKKPGLHRIFFGEGLANIASSFIGGLGACSYGEGIATVGFSKCASHQVPIGAALLLIFMGFFEPIQAFISSIPSAVIGGGTACILYGFISSSGIKVLQEVDLNNQKNLIIASVVMSLGICGVAVGNTTLSISGTALALVTGVILNLVLKDKNK